jgi:putative DNA-binding protein
MRTSANIQRSLGQFEARRFAPTLAPGTASRRTQSPIEVLCAEFPVVRRLVGDESFRAMAGRFIASEPPCFHALRHQGETFPRFLRGLGNTASIEYVADIAELEMVQGKALHAQIGLPVRASAVSSLRHGCHGDVRVLLHPSVFLVASRFPIVTVWRNNRSGGKNTMIERWRAESALVARPFLDVQVWCLPAGGHTFISALAEGHTVSTAIDAGRTAVPDFDIVSNLAMLDEANIIVGFRERQTVS